ncbi:TPA: hypothetical protein EYP66_01220 [Candidatus Poribacteria bacterium]|nr:hypothetical protein [Candidatus Poribacteria bacterium]
MSCGIIRYNLLKYILVLAIFVWGCGEDEIFEYEPPSPVKPTGLSALEFPTKNGSQWTYIAKDTQERYTLSIDGVKDVNGFTNRRLKNSARNAPTDFLSANGWYFRFNGEYILWPFPVTTTYFVKTTDAYIENAFDVFIEILSNEPIFQKHFPPRKLWEFPLQVGNQWTVFEKNTPPKVIDIRRVSSDKVKVTVPSGTYTDAYLIEEFIHIGENENIVFDKPDSKYWIAPDVGLVKYEYTDYSANPEGVKKVYELMKIIIPE